MKPKPSLPRYEATRDGNLYAWILRAADRARESRRAIAAAGVRARRASIAQEMRALLDQEARDAKRGPRY